LSGTKIYPGTIAYKKEVQFRISAPEGTVFNPENDYSYQGLSAGTVVKSEYIPVYDAGCWYLEGNRAQHRKARLKTMVCPRQLPR